MVRGKLACAAGGLLLPALSGCGGSIGQVDADAGRAMDSGAPIDAAPAVDSGAAVDGGPVADAAGAAAFPVGTYTRCAQGLHDPHGAFLDVAGWEPGAVLTVARSGDALSARYVDENGLPWSFRFVPSTGASATLAPSGQELPGFGGMCVMGPGNESFFPARMDVAAGALTYDEGASFVTLGGVLQGDAGPCGAASAPATVWIVCADAQDGGPSPQPSDAGTSSTAPSLPVGSYVCTAEIATYERVGGINEYVSSGGAGSLELTQEGVEVAADYAGDSALAGKFRLIADTAATAHAETGQSVTASCAAPVSMGGGPSPAAGKLSVTAGSLAVVGATLVVSIAGDVDATSACPGARIAASLVCSKQ